MIMNGEICGGQPLALAISTLAPLSRQELVHAAQRVDDGFNHPLIVTCSVALAGLLALVVMITLAAWYWRRTHVALRALRFIAVDELPATLVEAMARTGTASMIRAMCDPTPVAFTRGWLRPRIVVSTGMLAQLEHAELDAVLLHERAHTERRDPLRALIARAAASTFAVIPGTAGLLRVYLCRLEIAADASVVSAMRSPLPLASALHRLLSAGISGPNPATVGLSPTDVRIDHLLGEPTSVRGLLEPPSIWHIAAFVAGVAVVALLVLGSAHSVNTCVFGASASGC